jgi:pyruvate dehydrogenase E1 component alpha subunit
VLLDLRRDDTLIIGPADVAAVLVKGVPLRALLGGLGDPAWAGHAPCHVLPACADVATRLALAAGAAATAKQKKDASLVVVFYDAAAPAPASWLQSMRFAARHALPILFVCWNARPKRDLYREADRCGFPGIAVEGHDAVAVYRVASEAIAHGRRGNGPTFIECKSGFPAGFGGGLFDGAADAIRNMEAYLAGKGLYEAQAKRRIIVEFGTELAAAVGKSRPARRPRR